MKIFDDAIKACDVALKIDCNLVKAYYRRAIAKQIISKNIEDSLSDFRQAYELDPNNIEIKREIQKIENL